MEGDFVVVRVWELAEEVGIWGRWEVEKRERGVVYTPHRVPQRRLVASAKPMCSFYKVLNQRVDWVAWANIQIYGARDAIDDACTTSGAHDTGAEYALGAVGSFAFSLA